MRALAAAMLVLIASACADASGEAAELESGVWRLQTIDGDVFEGDASKITFDNGRYTANLGCNTMGGAYTLNGDNIMFGQGVSTLIGCLEPIASWETRLNRVLNGQRRWRIEAAMLTLLDESGAPAAAFIR